MKKDGFPLSITLLFVEHEGAPIYFYERLTQEWQDSFSFSSALSYLVPAS